MVSFPFRAAKAKWDPAVHTWEIVNKVPSTSMEEYQRKSKREHGFSTYLASTKSPTPPGHGVSGYYTETLDFHLHPAETRGLSLCALGW